MAEPTQDPPGIADRGFHFAFETGLSILGREKPEHGDVGTARKLGRKLADGDLAVGQFGAQAHLADDPALEGDGIHREVQGTVDVGGQGEPRRAIPGGHRGGPQDHIRPPFGAARPAGRRRSAGRGGQGKPFVHVDVVDGDLDRDVGGVAQFHQNVAGGPGVAKAQGEVLELGAGGGGHDGAFEAEGLVEETRQRTAHPGGGDEGRQFVHLALHLALEARRVGEVEQGPSDPYPGTAGCARDGQGNGHRTLLDDPAHGHLVAERNAAGHQPTGAFEGAAERSSGQAGVDLRHPFDGALSAVPENECPVLDGEIVQPHGRLETAGCRLIALLARLVRRRRGGRGGLAPGGEIPVPAPVAEDLEFDHRLDQLDRFHLELTGQQRPQGDTDLERLQAHHVGGGSAFQVDQHHVVDDQGRRRQKRDPDVAADDERAPGEGFGAGGDLFPVVVPIDQAGTDQNRRHEDEDESDDAEQNLLHALTSTP